MANTYPLVPFLVQFVVTAFVTMLTIALLWTALALAGSVNSRILYAGVNESGGEFGVYNSNGVIQGLPGTFGKDYAFINKSTVDIFVDQQKVNLFRVAFLLERMCPVDQSTGKGLGGTFDENYFAEYADAINYITQTKGVYAILDPHNYMRYNNPSQQPASGSIIGDTAGDSRAASTQDFAAFFSAFASRFASNPKPHDLSTQLLLDNEQAAVNAIRQAGALQLILAPGNGYTGGHSFTQSAGNQDPSSDYLYKLNDPQNNLAIEIHEYLDSDFSGLNAVCSQSAPSNLAAVTDWATQHGLSLFLTEFGSGANQNCYQYLADLLNFVEGSSPWIGWVAWAAGPLWGTWDSCCGPDTGSLEPGDVTSSGTAGGFETVWKQGIAPFIPTNLKSSGTSGLQ